MTSGNNGNAYSQALDAPGLPATLTQAYSYDNVNLLGRPSRSRTTRWTGGCFSFGGGGGAPSGSSNDGPTFWTVSALAVVLLLFEFARRVSKAEFPAFIAFTVFVVAM